VTRFPPEGRPTNVSGATSKIWRRALFNLRSLDLNLLTVFEAIYELGTVSGAADHLGLSQSATSHALSRLREVCKDDLFVRTRQGLSPTPVAKEMYPAIKQALEALRASLAEASGFDPARSQRRFRIGIPHPMGPFYALSLRAAVAAVAPGIVLTFDTVSRPVALEDNLRDGIVDIAIDWLPVALDPFVNKKLFDDHVVLLARSDHPSVNVGITTEDLRAAEFVTLHRRTKIGHAPQALEDVSKLIVHEVVRVSELLEIPTVVASTDLLGIFLSSMGPFMAKRLGLRVLPLPLELPPMPIYMIWHENRRHDTAHRWLRAVVVDELRRFASS
jgi:DNA-binding transcriptional LysR family regulator